MTDEERAIYLHIAKHLYAIGKLYKFSITSANEVSCGYGMLSSDGYWQFQLWIK